VPIWPVPIGVPVKRRTRASRWPAARSRSPSHSAETSSGPGMPGLRGTPGLPGLRTACTSSLGRSRRVPSPAVSLVIKMTLGALLLAKVLLVLWGVNRGFDLGDGGFFLLNLNRPAESPPLFEFYKLLLLLEPRPRFDAIDARLIRIAVEAVATLALVHGVWVWARARATGAAGAGFLGLLLFTGLGTFLSVAAREFGYNDASATDTPANIRHSLKLSERMLGIARTFLCQSRSGSPPRRRAKRQGPRNPGKM